MPRKKKVLLSEIDVGAWAGHYATRPYGHYKQEVYQLFIDVLSLLPAEARLLDIGAGPGHLAVEFFKRRPKSAFTFVLLDAGAELLKIAAERLRPRAKRVRTVNRSFNIKGWEKGLGRFDAIASNNALFHVRPRKFKSFYRTCFSLLKRDGILLNQQSFAFVGDKSPYGDDAFSQFMRDLPGRIMPQMSGLTESDTRRLEKEKSEALATHRKALAEAKAAGVSFRSNQTGYHFLTVEKHLEAMRDAGFAAGCLWRKREFAVVAGVKGRPLARP